MAFSFVPDSYAIWSNAKVFAFKQRRFSTTIRVRAQLQYIKCFSCKYNRRNRVSITITGHNISGEHGYVEVSEREVLLSLCKLYYVIFVWTPYVDMLKGFLVELILR